MMFFWLNGVSRSEIVVSDAAMQNYFDTATIATNP